MRKTAEFYKSKEYKGIPVPTKKKENREKLGQNTEDKLVEWEKNQVKELWNQFDKEKKGL